jgi:hypothetical protein
LGSWALWALWLFGLLGSLGKTKKCHRCSSLLVGPDFEVRGVLRGPGGGRGPTPYKHSMHTCISAGHDLNKVKLEAFGVTNSGLPGGSVNIQRGAAKLIERLADSINSPSCLKLGKLRHIATHEINSLVPLEIWDYRLLLRYKYAIQGYDVRSSTLTYNLMSYTPVLV